MSDVGSEGWTLGTLEKYLSKSIRDEHLRSEQRFGDSEKAVRAALEAADKAVAAALQAQKEASQKAEMSAENRHLDLVTRLDQTAGTLTEKITTLALRYEEVVGSGKGMDRAWGYLVGAVGITVAVASRWHP